MREAPMPLIAGMLSSPRPGRLAPPRAALHAPRAALDELLVGARGVAHAERDRAHARPVAAREVLRERARLGVDDEVDVALLVERDALVSMARDRLEAHALEQRAERGRVGRRVLDELEAVGLNRVHGGIKRLGHAPF